METKKSTLSEIREKLLDRVVGKISSQYPNTLPGKWDLWTLQATWGNLGFMASLNYLKRIRDAAQTIDGPILECGSGLTTLLMGILTKNRKTPIFALEHHEGWQQRMETVVKHYDLNHVTIIKAPLKNFGEYEWYEFDKSILPENIALVVCDGPPGNIKGSRYGLIPEMNSFLSQDCTILLDDAGRKNEKQVMESWKSRHGFNYQLVGGFQKFGLVNRMVK